MTSVHTEKDIRAECERIIAEHGPSALGRDAVQEALRRRADAAGQPTKGADNGTVGRVIRSVLDERRSIRAAATEADVAAAMAGEVPVRVEELLTQFGATMRGLLGGVVAEVQRRVEAEAQVRVQAAEHAARARVAELTGELESRREEAEALASDHERALTELEEHGRELETLRTAVAQRASTEAERLAEADRRIGQLEADIRAAEVGRRDAETQAHAAALTSSRLEGGVARLEERLAAAERARDEWREVAQRQEAQMREVERLAEERRVRLELLAPAPTTLRRRAQVDESSASVALPGAGRPGRGNRRTHREKPMAAAPES